MKTYSFMEFDEPVVKEKKPKILLIDGSNLIFRIIYSAIFTEPDDNNTGFYFFRHLFINNLFSLITEFKPTKVIFAIDGKPSWRYRLFADYKSHRKDARDKSIVDFDKFFPMLDDFLGEIQETFSKIRILKIENCEADDVIAITCRNILKNEDITIVSSDGDFKQLISNNVKLYDAMKKITVESLNPRRDLDIKILTGDKSDGIPPIRPKIGPKTAIKILDGSLEEFLNENEDLKTNYIRNKQLIDFDFIPEDIKNKIINTYNQYELTDLIASKTIEFFRNNRLMKIMSGWDAIADNIKSLN